MIFNPEDRHWKCLCGSMHVITGATVLAILGIIFGIISIIGILWMVPICILMLYGVKNDRKGFIIPYLVMQVILILLGIATFIWHLYEIIHASVAGNSTGIYYSVDKHDFGFRKWTYWDGTSFIIVVSMGWLICMVAWSAISVFLNIYFGYVVYLAYKFIEAKIAAISSGVYQDISQGVPMTVVYQNYQPQQPQVVYTQPYPPQAAYGPANPNQPKYPTQPQPQPPYGPANPNQPQYPKL